MDKQTIDEIKRLKEEIFKQKEAVTDIRDLVKKEIDRDFPINLWELSERELDNEMGNRLSFLNDDIDPRPDNSSITSHRRFLGKPVVLFKRLLMRLARPYTNLLLEKQRRFNDQAVAFHLASFIRIRQNEQHIRDLHEKLKTIEEDQELLISEINSKKDDLY